MIQEAAPKVGDAVEVEGREATVTDWFFAPSGRDSHMFLVVRFTDDPFDTQTVRHDAAKSTS